MTPEELERRIARIEERLGLVEHALGTAVSPEPATNATAPTPQSHAAPPPARTSEPTAPAGHAAEERPSLVTSILGWGGAIALVLAAAYLIRLAVENGWLTPVRQLALATLSGAVMILVGLHLRTANRRYAGLLAAGGVAVLFLSIYGAHLFYGYIGPTPAASGVIFVCLLSLWLCRMFRSDLYALFAVAGSYSAPLMIMGAPSITDLVIYFSAWSVVFSVFSILHGRRLVYLLAAYLALIVFDFMVRKRTPDAWTAALVFQAGQFVIFGVATATFSIRTRSTLTLDSALGHLPLLLIFYFLEYSLLQRHLPDLAPWIAAAGALVLGGIYATARAALQRPLPGGEFLLWAYVALVLFHAGYIESVPHRWAPWVAFAAMPLITFLTFGRGGKFKGSWPVWAVVGLIFLVNYLRIILDVDLQAVPGRSTLAILYAASLYLGYLLGRNTEWLKGAEMLALYAGHICAMAAGLHLLDEPIVESAVWGVLALACLGVSLWQRDRVLGQSSLLVFAAAAAKVLLYDLGEAPPLIRIVSLVVLGVTFYVGGLWYQRMLAVGRDAPMQDSGCA